MGGVLATLIGEYIPSRKEERIIAFINSLAKALAKLETTIKQDVVFTDEFAFLFEKSLRGVAENYQQEKIDSYKAILTNILSNKVGVETEQREVFLNILDGITVRHIRILGILNKHQEGDLYSTTRNYFSEYSDEDINFVIDNLRNKGLVRPRAAIMSSSLSDNFNQLTQTGKLFVEFITL